MSYSYNDSFPFAALPANEAAGLIRTIVAEEVRKALDQMTPTSTSDQYEPILDVPAALKYLESVGIPIPVSSLYKGTSSGALKCERIGRRLLFTESQLLDWLSSMIIAPETKSDAALRLAESARRKERGSKKQP